MQAEPSLTVISLGGVVHSSVVAFMASAGAFDHVPDCAVFADTRSEPPSVYEHVKWLEGQLSSPPYVVDNGRSRREVVKALTNPPRLPQLRGHPRLPEETRRGGRRHRPPVHRQLQEQAHSPQDTRPARTEIPMASARRKDRRAVTGNLH